MTILGITTSMETPSPRARALARSVIALALATVMTGAVMTGAHVLVGALG